MIDIQLLWKKPNGPIFGKKGHFPRISDGFSEISVGSKGLTTRSPHSELFSKNKKNSNYDTFTPYIYFTFNMFSVFVKWQ